MFVQKIMLNYRFTDMKRITRRIDVERDTILLPVIILILCHNFDFYI